MKKLAKRLCLLFSAFFFLLSVSAAPSGYRIRYVNAEEGTYGGDGLSWATAKNNIQNAIDELNAEVSRRCAVSSSWLGPTAPKA